MKYFEKQAAGPKIRTYSQLIKDMPFLATHKKYKPNWFAPAYYSELTGIVLKDSLKGRKKENIIRHELTHWLRHKKGLWPDKEKFNFFDTLKEETAAHYGGQPRKRNKYLKNIIGALGGFGQAATQHPEVGIPVMAGILGAELVTLKKLDKKK